MVINSLQKLSRFIFKNYMTEQQKHLQELLQKKESVLKDLENLQIEMNSKREIFLKIQGIIEYLTQTGVTLPEESKEEEKTEEVSS